jgi:hypothetical protein
MKRFLASVFFACVAALAITACGTSGTAPAALTAAPSADQVVAIQNACAIDAGIRPTVTALLTVPGLATVQEVAAVTAARAVIDPICANPSGSVQANTLAVLTGATGNVLAIVTQLQARKSGSEPAAK